MAINILTTLEYLGLYGNGAGGSTYFGLVLSVATDRGTVVNNAVVPFLQPWKWSVLAVSLWEMNLDGSNPTPLIGVQAVVSPAGFSLDTSITSNTGALQRDFDTNKGDDFCWTDPQTVDTAKPGGATNLNTSGSRYPWPAHLAQLARYPYPIPHLLNLAFVVNVGPQAVGVPFSPAPNKAYAAAVTFKSSVAPGATTYKPAPIAFIPDKGNRVSIPFDSGPVSTITQLLPGTDAIAGVSNQILSLGVPETSDWQAHLVPAVGDLFDLSSLLIRPVRTACDHLQDPDPAVATFKNAIAADFGNLCRATVNAQRNILAYGAGVAPDGTSLLQQVSNIWINNASSQDAIKMSQMKQFVNDFTLAVVDAKNKDTDAAWQGFLAKNVELQTNPLVQSPPLSVDALHLSDKLIPLEHLQLRFTQNDLITELLLAQWDFVYQAYSAQYLSFQAQYQDFRNSAITTMATLNLRGILQRGNLENDWLAIVASVSNDKNTLRNNIKTQLSTKLTSRFPAGSSSAIDAIRAALLLDSDSWLAKQLELLVPISNNALPTRTSEGISLVVDTLDAGSGLNDVTDTLRSMIGYCVLMRDTTANFDHSWRCLNVGFLKTGTPPRLIDAVVNLADPVVIPVPQHIQDQMRRAILTYNNQPLMVESPAHAFGQGLMDPNSERFISFLHPSVTATLDASNPKWKIPGLVFGHTYEFKIGRVRNCGALPATFTTSAHPTLLDLNIVEANYAAHSAPSILYLRTVPVGDLRFAANDQGTFASSVSKLALPAIPPDAQPRSRELYPTPSSDAPATAQPPVPPQPLIMLTSYTTEFAKAKADFTLRIQKPTTDLQTWDRWMAASPGNLPQRIAMWTKFHQLARQDTNSDLAIDDPAVQQLQISFVINDPGLGSVSVPKAGDPAIVATWPSPATTTVPPRSVTNNATPLSLKIVAASSTKSSFDASTWTLTLAAGAVVKITLSPLVVPGSQGSALFATGISQGVSYEFLAEAANSALPTSEDLRAAFSVSPPSNPAYNSVDFALPLTPPSVIGDQIRKATVETQIWRWDGRPLSLFNFGYDLAKPDPRVLEWEVGAFATRLLTDSTIRPMSLVTVPPSTGKPANLTLVAKDDITGQLGALYYRSGVQVYNRYGSLVPVADRSVSTLDDTRSLPGTNGGWHRTLVRCRLPNTTLPKPAIKFLVPLTGALTVTPPKDNQPPKYNAQAAASSVLVVVQGPWYSLGGLAEDLEVAIVFSGLEPSRSKVPEVGPDSFQPKVPEVGPDPIIWHGKRSAFPASYATYDQDKDGKSTEGSGFATADKRLHGPVGHTFDNSDINPLWVNTTFVLDPPPPVHSDAQPWTFAKVAFRRTIHKEGWLPAPPSKDNLSSEWTDPQWVQFLPSQFTGLGKAVDLSKCSVSVNTSTKIASILGPSATPLTLSDDTGDAHMFFALLLTEQVPDLLGRKGQERYFQVCVRRTDPSNASWSYDKTTDSKSLWVGRILTIQVNPVTSATPITNEDLLWSALFPQNGATTGLNSDANARIVAVSPPIAANALSCSII